MDKSLNWYLEEARKNHYALGHFNFSTEDVLRGIVEASKDAGAPAVMVGTSEGEADYVGLYEAVALVGAVRKHYNFPVFLNADHFKSFGKCQEAIDAGYDSVIIDESKMAFADNISASKKVVEYARQVSKSRNIEITVEGEIGYLRGSSEVQKKVEITPDDYTKTEEAKEFVTKTGVDRLAVVFGNIHGIVTDQEETLDIEHFKRIVEAVPKPYYVLHGASGLKDKDVKAAIKAGVTNVHFNTELRVAYTEGLHKALHDKPGETTPYKYLKVGVDEMKKVVAAKVKMFMGR
ncbi:MAG: class II fructose-bisphosphate aldolase [Candidatus Taylorbacteria bacterium]|nr:class II fructose-bisphosphate aldolase [Candidatus Taylorbacteria bacterium]